MSAQAEHLPQSATGPAEPRPSPSSRLAIAIGLSFALQAGYVLLAPLDRLTTMTVVDDAFYYLQIARRFVAGEGFTFDGLHRTNGFQPLWQLLALPAALLPGREAPLRGLLLEAALLYQLAGLTLFGWLRRAVSGPAAWAGLLLWAFNARLLFTYAISGMEFSLFALTALLLVDRAHAAATRPSGLRLGEGFLLGALAGLNALARIDGALLAAVLLGHALFRARRLPVPALARAAGAMFVSAVAVVAPYLLWNALTFGHLLPVTGPLKVFRNAERLRSLAIEPWTFGHALQAFEAAGFQLTKNLMRFLTGYFYYPARELGLGQAPAGLLGLLLLAAVAVGGTLRTAPGARLAPWRALGPPAAAALIHLAAMALTLSIYIDYGNWYFGPLYAVFAAASAVAAAPVLSAARRWASPVAAAFLGLNAAVFLLRHDEIKINVLGAREALAFIEARWAGERIGSWNAGYLGYFAERNTFVNLDGLVGDYDLAELHLTRGSIRAYLERQAIDYVCDYATRPEHLAQGLYGLPPEAYEPLFASAFYAPPFIDSRIYYVLRLRDEPPRPSSPGKPTLDSTPAAGEHEPAGAAGASMPSMLVISFVEWSGAFQRPQHLALGFARRGWDVTYLSPAYVHRKRQQVPSGLPLPATLSILQPPALPGGRFLEVIGRWNLARLGAGLRRAASGPWDVVVFNDPRAAELAASLPARLRVFDLMDDLRLHAGERAGFERMERRALAIADRVWSGTASLADRWVGAHARLKFIACGVDGERFAAPEPEAVAAARAELEPWLDALGRPPLAGFFGVLNERLRIELLAALADRGWAALLIGPVSSRRPSLPRSSRLRWIGPRPYAALPAYLALMDLATVPYAVDGPHRCLYPVKALEYLAGGRPVLSTPLPDVERFLGEFVWLADGPAAWAAAGDDWPARRADALERARRGQAFALARGWTAMIDEMQEDLADGGRLGGA